MSFLKRIKYPMICRIVGEENIPEIRPFLKKDSIRTYLFNELNYLEKHIRELVRSGKAEIHEIEIIRVDFLFCEYAYKVRNVNTKEVYFSTQEILIF